MKYNKNPDRWEASLLAAAMAVGGAPFLFDRLGALVNSGLLSLSMVLHAAPILLVVAGAIVLLTEPSGVRSDSAAGSAKEGHHEL